MQKWKGDEEEAPVGKSLAVQTRGPQFSIPSPMQKSGMIGNASTLVLG